MQQQNTNYPPFHPRQVHELLREWGIAVPGDVETNVARARATYARLHAYGLMDMPEESLEAFRRVREEGVKGIHEDPEAAFLLNVTTGGVFWAIHYTTGDEFDVRWKGYRAELVLTPSESRFCMIPWIWPGNFLALPRDANWHPVIPFLLQRLKEERQELPWSIRRFRLWKDGARGYLEGRWDPTLWRERFDNCDFDPGRKANPNLKAFAHLVSEMGRSGRPPTPVAFLSVDSGIDQIRQHARELLADGLPATQLAVANHLTASEGTIRRYVREAGFRDWHDFLSRGL